MFYNTSPVNDSTSKQASYKTIAKIQFAFQAHPDNLGNTIPGVQGEMHNCARLRAQTQARKYKPPFSPKLQ